MLFAKYLPHLYQGAEPTGRRVLNLGGGSEPAPQPTSTTTTTTTIPEYAQPYMERLLGKAEAASTAPYQTYGGERLAPESALEQQARASVAGMQMPGQFQAGAQLAALGGLQGLQAGQYQPSAFATPLTQAQQLQAFQMGGPGQVRGGTGSFTGAGTAEQFMSPYMQNVVDVQKQEAIRDAQKGQLAANLGAARQGTYGGARQLLASTERERNLGTQLGQIQAAGSQAAYDQAQKAFEQEQARRLQAGLQTQQLGQQAGIQNLQAALGVQQLGAQQSLQAQQYNQQALLEAQRMAEQSRQYGANLGLQGAQAATQAGATLGQLGEQQQRTGANIATLQQQFGQNQQQQQQAALDLAYQDFLAQQRYPYTQLGFMSDILRGSGNLAQTGGTAVYSAQPTMTQQLLGLGGAALGQYLKAKTGGHLKKDPNTGLMGLALHNLEK